MQIVHTLAELRQQLQPTGVGFVPTMGFLHQGHASLIRRARAENSQVVLSIFVNPTQFAATEDLSRYPRDLAQDCNIAQAAGADVVFCPDVSQMYPAGFASQITVTGVAEPLEGERRPGHFAGVATVVAKLFNMVQPQRAYFGEKDYQQLQVIRRLVQDLNFPVDIVACPTERAESGLALSSRNSYLTPAQQQRAVVIYRSLQACRAAYLAGERQTEAILAAGLAICAQEPELQLEYLSLVDENLKYSSTVTSADSTRLLIAAQLFGVRLIDNMGVI